MGSSSPPCITCAATGRPSGAEASGTGAPAAFSCLFLALLGLLLLSSGFLSCRDARSAGGLGGALAGLRLELGSELPLRTALGSECFEGASGRGARLELDLLDPSISETASVWGAPPGDTALTGLRA